ncbi:MAG: RNA-binding protein [Thaumarchaeota archaeon]|nr:RNA-binding protein [Nitrososphaerota archaeon]
MSKSARDDLLENLKKLSNVAPIKSKDLKIAEGDDPSISIIFDEKDKIFLGSKKKNKDEKGSEMVYFPLLKDEWILPSRPTVTVDSGAVKFVVNGANIMRPGITKFEGEFHPGDIVVVREEKYGKAIAVGEVTISRLEMEQTKKGAIVNNLHYAGDKFWEMLKGIPLDH